MQKQLSILLLIVLTSFGAFAQNKKKTKAPVPLTTPIVQATKPPQINFDSTFKAIKWRNIGPFRGGRSVAVSGVIGHPQTYYMGTTGGGLWKTNYMKLYEMKGIPHEPTSKTGLKHTDGVLSLARNLPGTANAEFFICIGNQPGLDEGGENVEDKLGYAAFGKVVKGMSIVRKIYMLNDHEQMLTPPVAIYNITRK